MKHRKRQPDGHRQILVVGELELPFLQFKSDLGPHSARFAASSPSNCVFRALSRTPVPPSFTKV